MQPVIVWLPTGTQGIGAGLAPEPIEGWVPEQNLIGRCALNDTHVYWLTQYANETGRLATLYAFDGPKPIAVWDELIQDAIGYLNFRFWNVEIPDDRVGLGRWLYEDLTV